MNKFYITTPIYYANGKPHIGHAYTTVAADVLARWHKLQKEEVFFLTGTDEHGLKIQKKAEEKGKDPQKFADEIAEEFKILWDKLNIKYDNFIRTTDDNHKKAAQKALQALYDKGAIYKGEYEGLYCVGCEQFKNENELVDGKCPDHGTVPEKMKEECYLLKLAELQNDLIEKIENDKFRIAPARYKNEVLSFLKNQELKDISVSRKNVRWGIPLPFDKEHTAYVWIDALLNYLTGLGWDGVKIPLSPPFKKGEKQLSPFAKGRDGEGFLKFWPPDIQLIGKDILRVHAIIWPILLMHLEAQPPKLLFAHGHLLSGGKKMSKTLGNAITVDEMLEKFGTDGTRYLLLSTGTFGEDVDVTMERMVEKYNADLANGLGNLVSRVIKLASNSQFAIRNSHIFTNYKLPAYRTGRPALPTGRQIKNLIEKTELNDALEFIWGIVRFDNKYIEDNKPWELVKTDQKKFEKVMEKLINDLRLISELLTSFMPETSEKIAEALNNKQAIILFQRIK